MGSAILTGSYIRNWKVVASKRRFQNTILGLIQNSQQFLFTAWMVVGSLTFPSPSKFFFNKEGSMKLNCVSDPTWSDWPRELGFLRKERKRWRHNSSGASTSRKMLINLLNPSRSISCKNSSTIYLCFCIQIN